MIRESTTNEELNKILAQCPPDTIIGEFAGRDSVAAIFKALKQNDVRYILPVATFAPVEYGSASVLEENHRLLSREVALQYEDKKTVGPLIYLSNRGLWQALNSSFVGRLQHRYGFYTPCIACHAYMHLIRMPLARQFSGVLISGEREHHDNRLKVNQLNICLDSYQRILKHFEVDLWMPLRYARQSRLIEALVGWEWEEGKAQADCLFDGSEKNRDGQAMFDYARIHHYLTSFLEPACIALGTLLLKEPNISFEKLKESVHQIEEN